MFLNPSLTFYFKMCISTNTGIRALITFFRLWFLYVDSNK